ncbi:MAG: Clp1/GlmU family protein [Candidatus Bathyarchaeia archaeon]
MRERVERGKTLLVDGPARIFIYSGTMKAFGAQIGAKEHIIVRLGKRIPLEAIEESEVEFLLGEKASYEVINGSPIPPSWEEVSMKILSFNNRVEVAVLGGTDSGKSSFSTYLANMALNNGRKVALVDGDLGQSDIGPPGTLGLSILKKPIIDPSNLRPDHIVFIGITSPQSVIDRVISGLVKLRDRALSMGSDLIIVNTDGWIEGEEAVNYKRQLIKILEPTFTVIMQNKGNLTPLVNFLAENETNILLAETPEKIKKRDRETRKAIRETLYKRYLRNAKIRSVPLSWAKIDGNFVIKGKQDPNLKKRLEEILGDKVIYCESLRDHVILVLKNGVLLNDEEKNKISAELNKPAKIIFEGSEKGMLLSLEDNEGRFLGVGIIHCIDYERGIIKICTNTEKVFSRLHVGRIRLDEKGNEIEVTEVISLYILPQRGIAP